MTRFYKILLALALFVSACGEKIEQPPIALADVTEVVLEVSSKMMVANGEDKVYFTVWGNGHDLTKWAKIYPNGGFEHIGTSFSTAKAGIYEFWAEVGTAQTPKGVFARVEAVEHQIPAAPSDPQPSNTSFVKRAFVLQFTGTGCGYCPWFIAALEELADDASYSDKFVLAAAHTFPSEPADPMYIKDEYLYCGKGYPYLQIDYDSWLSHQTNVALNVQNIKAHIDNTLSYGSETGISVNSELIGSYLTVNVRVKTVIGREYYASCWLLEDGVGADQANYTGLEIGNVHNAVIRACTPSFEGKPLGVISAGEYSETAFTYSLKSGWNKDNCRLLVFVSRHTTLGLRVDNCISAPLGVPVQFQYVQ